MFTEISWHAFLRVNTADKARKLLGQIEEVCRTKVTLSSCERYWKDNGLFDVTFSTPLNESDAADAVFEALRTAGELAYQWQVNAAELHQDGRLSGIATQTRITGIEWIQFAITPSD